MKASILLKDFKMYIFQHSVFHSTLVPGSIREHGGTKGRFIAAESYAVYNDAYREVHRYSFSSKTLSGRPLYVTLSGTTCSWMLNTSKGEISTEWDRPRITVYKGTHVPKQTAWSATCRDASSHSFVRRSLHTHRLILVQFCRCRYL